MRGPRHEQPDEYPEDAELLRAVMEYLGENPQAMDTLEGIAQWWILPRTTRLDHFQLARVVDRLISQGILEKIGAGENARYRLKQ